MSRWPNKPGDSAPRLLLAGGDLVDDPAASRNGSLHSSYARELLSELAAQIGMHCCPALWSPRGQGKPTHPDLESGWYANITHKHGRVMVGLADSCFGIDLEYAAPRRTARLDAMIDQLPEPWVRQRIREASSPAAAFYQSWTLYESLFKHAGHGTHSAKSVFTMRLTDLAVRKLDCTIWQGGQWTLAVVSDVPMYYSPDPETLFPELKSISPFILD